MQRKINVSKADRDHNKRCSKRSQLITSGICVRCARDPAQKGYRQCYYCRMRHREYERKAVRLRRDAENGKNAQATVDDYEDLYFPPGGGVSPRFRSQKDHADAIRDGVTGNEWYWSFHNKHMPTIFEPGVGA